MTDPRARPVRALVVGGGQAGLATAFYLRRRGIEHVVLDDQERPSGAWRPTWDSLRLFSPAAYSSLPGWRMPATAGEGYPDAGHVIDYLTRYEERYDIPVRRRERVIAVDRSDGGYRVQTSQRVWHAEVVLGTPGAHRPRHWTPATRADVRAVCPRGVAWADGTTRPVDTVI